MDAQELIQVNLQLPTSALDGLTRLAEQLQRLAAAVQPEPLPAQAQEHGENTAFDFSKYQDLRIEQEIPNPPTAQATETILAPAESAREAVTEAPPAPEAAARDVTQQLKDPAQAGSSPNETANAETAAAPAFQELTEGRSIQSEVEHSPEEVPAAQPEAPQSVPTPQAARSDAESPIPNAQAPAEPQWEPLSLFTAAGPEMTAAEAPSGAGFTVTSVPETPQNQQNFHTISPTYKNPLPTTPESISRAFQQDSRRYDAGFPLY